MAFRLSSVPFYEGQGVSGGGTTPTIGDIEYREIMDQLVDIRNEDMTIVDILNFTGAYAPAYNKDLFIYTNDWLYHKATINNGAGYSLTSGNAATVVFDSTAKIRANTFLLTKDGKIGYVQSVDSATEITLYPTEDITFADNETVTFPTNGIAEGSSGARETVSDLIKRQNQLQYFYNAQEVTDLTMAGRTEIDFGAGEKYYYYKLQHDAYRKHIMDIANAFIVGKYVKAQDADGNDVPMTRGLDAYITDHGGVDQSTAAAATVAKADFFTFSRALDQQRAPAEGHLWCGGDMNGKIDDLFDTQLADGAVRYDAFGKGDAKQKAVDLGIKSFTIYGRTFHKYMMPQLDHPEVTSADAFKYPRTAYFVPTGEIKAGGEGPDAGKMVKRARGRYLEIPGINSRYMERETGGLAQVPTADTNTLRISYNSWEGLELVGLEHFGKLDYAAS